MEIFISFQGRFRSIRRNGGCDREVKRPFFVEEYAIVGTDERIEDEDDENGSSVISPRTSIGIKADFLAAFPSYTEKEYMSMPIVKRWLMIIDKTKIDYKKNKKENNYNQNKTQSGKKDVGNVLLDFLNSGGK